jgi:hypothetical protein
METRLVESLGVQIGGRTLDEQPLELVRSTLVGRDDAFVEAEPAGEAARGSVQWSGEALDRLARVPNFVRGMVKRIYADYARDQGIATITPEVMDRARSDLGLEEM